MKPRSIAIVVAAIFVVIAVKANIPGLAAPMDSNEALRRLLAVFQDPTGNPMPGAPGGPVLGQNVGPVFRHAAAGPLPTVAYQLVAAQPTRTNGILRNMDATNTVYWGSSPTVTDATGSTLLAGENVPVGGYRGPIYIYCTAGSPIVEFTPVYNQ